MSAAAAGRHACSMRVRNVPSKRYSWVPTTSIAWVASRSQVARNAGAAPARQAQPGILHGNAAWRSARVSSCSHSPWWSGVRRAASRLDRLLPRTDC